MFDRIIVSTDDGSFKQYWPIVATAWRKFFPEKQISLAFVTNRGEDDSLVVKMREYGEVVLFPVVVGVPTPNQAKMARHILAGHYNEEVCMIEDIDTVPLQADFVNRVTGKKEQGKLLTVGVEVYKGSPHEGKFPISNITAESKIFKEIINPDNLSLLDLYKSWVTMYMFDHKEAIVNSPDVFSDESLMRALITKWNPDRSKITDVERNANVQSDWVDRSWWTIDKNKLHSGGYFICNFLRPFDVNYQNIEPVVHYIYGRTDISKDEVVLNG